MSRQSDMLVKSPPLKTGGTPQREPVIAEFGSLRRARLHHLTAAWVIACCALAGLARAAAATNTAPAAARPLANDRCPVMRDEFATPTHEAQFHGKVVRFCCDDCRERFAEDPGPYLPRLPQFTSAEVNGIVSGWHDAGRLMRADTWADRWSQPLFLSAAAAIAVWLAVRVTRRLRAATHPPVAPGELPPGRLS